MAKSWEDQPQEVVAATVLSRISIKGWTVEVRRGLFGAGGYYVTVGNLFASQTFRSTSADGVFALLDAVSHTSESGTLRSLPHGVTLMDPEEVPDAQAKP